jgi:hypothetical protein
VLEGGYGFPIAEKNIDDPKSQSFSSLTQQAMPPRASQETAATSSQPCSAPIPTPPAITAVPGGNVNVAGDENVDLELAGGLDRLPPLITPVEHFTNSHRHLPGSQILFDDAILSPRLNLPPSSAALRELASRETSRFSREPSLGDAEARTRECVDVQVAERWMRMRGVRVRELFVGSQPCRASLRTD